MLRFLSSAALAFTLNAPLPAAAAEKTVTLAVQNMTCALCPRTVKASLEAVPGVHKVIVSFDDKTATVTYDDREAAADALIKATTNVGYPSILKN